MLVLVGSDVNNSCWILIYLNQASLGQAQTYLVKGLSDRTVSAYYKYMVNVAVLLGAERYLHLIKPNKLSYFHSQVGGRTRIEGLHRV